MVWMLKNCCGNCSGSDPCGCLSASFECVSKEGDGYLRGWSKFQNQNSGDWNLRKYTAVNYAQSPSSFDVSEGFYYVSGPDSCDVSVGTIWVRSMGASSATWDTAGNNQVGSPQWVAYVCGTPNDYVDFTWPFSSFAGWSIITRSSSVVSDTAHQTSCPTTSCSSCGGIPGADPRKACADFQRRYCGTYIYLSVLSVPDTVAAALARGSPTISDSCTTLAGTISSTSAGSSSQITITGARSVTATITMEGVLDGQDYDLTITLSKYDTTLMTTVEEEDVVTVTAAAADTDTYEYEVPIEEGYEITLIDVALDAA